MRLIGLAVVLAVCFALAPLAEAQPAQGVRRIGLLVLGTPSAYATYVEALRQGLRDLGYVEQKNLLIEYRWAAGKYENLPDLARELVSLKVELIVTHGTPGARAAKQATTTIPIVMAVSGDAVATGLVDSIARPGANITGFTFFFPDLNAKRLELLKEAVPHARRMAALANRDNAGHTVALQVMERMAKALKVDLQANAVKTPREVPDVFSAMIERRVDAVVVLDDPMLISSIADIAGLAAKYRLPTIGFKENIDAGGLMAYSVNLGEFWRRSAVFVDKILKGARPAELPVEQATKFELIINLKTAKALGLTIPQSVLVRADHVIE